MEKECDILMLPTSKESNIGLYQGKLYYSSFGSKTDDWESQHIYVLSNDNIVSGELYVWLNNHQICKAEGMIDIINNHVKNGDIKKIIASSDDSLKYTVALTEDGTNLKRGIQVALPYIPKPFLETFITKQGNIKKVLVEYEEEEHPSLNEGTYSINPMVDYKLKLHKTSVFTSQIIINSFK